MNVKGFKNIKYKKGLALLSWVFLLFYVVSEPIYDRLMGFFGTDLLSQKEQTFAGYRNNNSFFSQKNPYTERYATVPMVTIWVKATCS